MNQEYTLAEFVDTVHTHTDNFIQTNAENVNDYYVVELTHVRYDGKIKIMLNKGTYVFAFDDEYNISPFTTSSESGFISELKNLEDTINGKYDYITKCNICKHIYAGKNMKCLNCDSISDIKYKKVIEDEM